MPALEARGSIQALDGAGGAHAGHVLGHPRELRRGQVAEPAQLSRGLELQAPGGQLSLQGL